MAAYRDSADWLRNGERSGHLIADDPAELAALAAALELSPRHFQGAAMLPHYQLPEWAQEKADALGVILLDRAAFTRMAGRVRDRWDARTRDARRVQTPRGPTSTSTATTHSHRHSTAATAASRVDASPAAPAQGALW